MKQHDWLTLQKEFFKKRPLNLQRIAGGDAITKIYLKMVFLAVQTSGKIEIKGGDLINGLAEELNEAISDVKRALEYLQTTGLAKCDSGAIWLRQAQRLSERPWRVGA